MYIMAALLLLLYYLWIIAPGLVECLHA
jgi:hypothetical protein